MKYIKKIVKRYGQFYKRQNIVLRWILSFLQHLDTLYYPFSLQLYFYFYVIFLVSCLTSFTIMGRGLAFLDLFLAFLDLFRFASLCDLSMFSGLIFWFICYSITFTDNSLVSSPSTSTPWIKRQLRLEHCSCLSCTASIFLSLFVR